jgi:hypothetical protein
MECPHLQNITETDNPAYTALYQQQNCFAHARVCVCVCQYLDNTEESGTMTLE